MANGPSDRQTVRACAINASKLQVASMITEHNLLVFKTADMCMTTTLDTALRHAAGRVCRVCMSRHVVVSDAHAEVLPMSVHAVVAATIARVSSCLHTLELTLMLRRLMTHATHVPCALHICHVSLEPWAHGRHGVRMPARSATTPARVAHVACDDDSCDSNAARTLGGCPGSVAAVAFASSAWDSWQLTCRETLQDLHD